MIGFLLFIGFMALIIWIEKRDRKKLKNKKKVIKLPPTGKDWYYNVYLPSEHWQDRRIKALEKANYTCQCCSSKKNLQVHHLTYKNVWHELDQDLKVVCRDCHKKIHLINSKKVS